MTVTKTDVAKGRFRFPRNVTGMTPFAIEIPQTAGISSEIGDVVLIAPMPSKGFIFAEDIAIVATPALDSDGTPALVYKFIIAKEDGTQIVQISQGLTNFQTDGEVTLNPPPAIPIVNWADESGGPLFLAIEIVTPAATPASGRVTFWGQYAANEVLIRED